MNPSPIAASQCVPKSQHDWTAFVGRNVRLSTWIHLNRIELNVKPYGDYFAIESGMLQELGLPENTERGQIRLDERQLIGIAKKVVGKLQYSQAWHADAQWALQQWQNGAFDGRNEDYVAIYMKDIKGYGSDPVALRSEWAQKCGVVPQRIIVDYIGTEE